MVPRGFLGKLQVKIKAILHVIFKVSTQHRQTIMIDRQDKKRTRRDNVGQDQTRLLQRTEYTNKDDGRLHSSNAIHCLT